MQWECYIFRFFFLYVERLVELIYNYESLAYVKEQLKNLKKYFDVELTYNSNAIEGNTLTITETKVILEEGLTIGGGKSLREHLEVINHQEAINYIEDSVNKNIDISERAIKDLHAIILKSIDNKNAGVYRKNNVLISGSKHRPVELAALFHFKYVYIHPFIHGNGRTARLLMNLILLRNGYPIAIIKNENRSEYMKALELASVEGEDKAFIEIIIQAVESSLDTYLYMIQQVDNIRYQKNYRR